MADRHFVVMDREAFGSVRFILRIRIRWAVLRWAVHRVLSLLSWRVRPTV